MEVNPTVAEMDAAQAEARAGRPGADPHIELCIPTVHDPSLAPEGKHVVTIDVNSQPYTLAEGSWDELRDEVADRAIAKLERLLPGPRPTRSSQRQVLAPPDLESLLGIWGGHALHGDMAFDQLFNLRPVRGWADYRTPVDGPLALRRRHPPRRRRHRRQRPQLRPRGDPRGARPQRATAAGARG